MALTFPLSPSINQTYTYNNNTWKWSGSSWIKVRDHIHDIQSISNLQSVLDTKISQSQMTTQLTSTFDPYVVNMNYQYGLVGDGTEDVSDILISTLNAGKVAQFNGGTYLIGKTVSSSTVRIKSTANKNSCIFKPTTTFSGGFMIECTNLYQLENISLEGRNTIGHYAFGTTKTVSVGGYIKNCNISWWDIGIYFGGSSYHPLGGYYTNVYVQGFQTGGIIIGSPIYTEQSGEDAIEFSGVIVTNGSTVHQEIVSTVNRYTSQDTITWTHTSPIPLFGYIVTRSANGVDGWHIPPNWNGFMFKDNTFTASKSQGETWVYKVYRATHGVTFSHLKNVLINNGHIGEQSTIGCVIYKCRATKISTGYYETDTASYGRGSFSAVLAYESEVEVGPMWVDNSAYAIISMNNAIVKSSLITFLTSRGFSQAYFGIGGATQQCIFYTGHRDSSSVPLIKSLYGSSYDQNYYINSCVPGQKRIIDSSHYVESIIQTSFCGVPKTIMKADETGGKIISNSIKVENNSKTNVQSPFVSSTVTTITNNTSTKIAAFTIPSTNCGGNIQLNFTARILYNSVFRQVISGSISVTYCSVGGTYYSSALIPTGSIHVLNTDGNTVSAVVSTTTVDNISNLFITINSTAASPLIEFQLLPTTNLGHQAANIQFF